MVSPLLLPAHTFSNGDTKASCFRGLQFNRGRKSVQGSTCFVFDIKRFHRHLYERHFTLLTDHELLHTIFGAKKGILILAASWLQRWNVISSAYD